MKRHFLPLLAAVALLTATGVGAQWPQFRGPEGHGTAAGSKPPLTWSEDKNVRWRTAIPGRGWSSPVLFDRQLWVTTATEDGRELSALALDVETGTMVHDVNVFRVEKPQEIHPVNSYASPTPVIEDGRVYVSFGYAGTAALDTKSGQVVWARRDLTCNHFRGPGSSPILFRNLLILHFDGIDVQYVVALDKHTGKTVWRTPRSIDFKDLGPDGKPIGDGDFRKAFTTPHIVTVDGGPVLISVGGKAAYGYDPLTGKERWRIEDRSSHTPSTRPVAGHGLVFYTTGWDAAKVVAIRPDGAGDVTKTHVVWTFTRAVPNKPSLLLDADLLFMINDNGVATAVEAKTGAMVWQARVGGTFSASPLSAAGRVYLFDEDGKTTVIEAGRMFKVVAENQLDNGVMASAAVGGDALYLRTTTDLYRIEEAKK